ncbi:MAG: ABC transporter permease [Prevotella sp.]|nr:ABC transporter permease [Candidatus Equicola stercoris]
MNLEYFIAKKICFGDTEKRRISGPAIKIATIGVAIGIAVMIMTVCVILGFKGSINDKITGLVGDIQIQSFSGIQYGVNTAMEITDTLTERLEEENKRTGNTMTFSPYCNVQGILKTDNDFLGITFKGIGEDYDTTFLHKSLVAGSIPSFETDKNRIIISQSIADVLNLKCYDKVFAYFVDENGVRVRKFTVEGIYQTNMSQHDNSLVFIDIQTARKLNKFSDTQCSGIEIRCHKQVNAIVGADNSASENQLIADNIREQINPLVFSSDKNSTDSYCVRTIQDIFPGIFAWLELLDVNVWIILILMVCVSAFTMTSGVLIIILEKTKMIGMLKALGQRNASIRKVFLWFATFIICKGIIIGNIIGIGICLLQKYTHFIHLDPTDYYVSSVPIAIDWGILVLLNMAVILFVVIVEIIPTLLISHIRPSNSMRYE